MLRLLHVACGVAVEPQHVVHDQDGGFVARGDLWLVGTRRLHEYDGAAHRERRRQRQDLHRDARIDRAGWTRRGFTREDVVHQGIVVLREADRALGRAHDPSRIRAWHRLLRESLVTAAGTARLSARVEGATRRSAETVQ